MGWKSRGDGRGGRGWVARIIEDEFPSRLGDGRKEEGGGSCSTEAEHQMLSSSLG